MGRVALEVYAVPVVALIRLLGPDDAEAFQQLRREALTQDPQAFGQAVEEAERMPVAIVRDRLAGAPDTFVVGAFLDGALVGVIGFVRATGVKTRHKGHLWGAYVTASMRGHGIGRQLLTRLLDEARALTGLSAITLSVAEGQASAQRLYRGAGFREYGREPRALKIAGRFFDEHLMVLEL